MIPRPLALDRGGRARCSGLGTLPKGAAVARGCVLWDTGLAGLARGHGQAVCYLSCCHRLCMGVVDPALVQSAYLRALACTREPPAGLSSA